MAHTTLFPFHSSRHQVVGTTHPTSPPLAWGQPGLGVRGSQRDQAREKNTHTHCHHVRTCGVTTRSRAARASPGVWFRRNTHQASSPPCISHFHNQRTCAAAHVQDVRSLTLDARRMHASRPNLSAPPTKRSPRYSHSAGAPLSRHSKSCATSSRSRERTMVVLLGYGFGCLPRSPSCELGERLRVPLFWICLCRESRPVKSRDNYPHCLVEGRDKPALSHPVEFHLDTSRNVGNAHHCH